MTRLLQASFTPHEESEGRLPERGAGLVFFVGSLQRRTEPGSSHTVVPYQPDRVAVLNQ